MQLVPQKRRRITAHDPVTQVGKASLQVCHQGKRRRSDPEYEDKQHRAKRRRIQKPDTVDRSFSLTWNDVRPNKRRQSVSHYLATPHIRKKSRLVVSDKNDPKFHDVRSPVSRSDKNRRVIPGFHGKRSHSSSSVTNKKSVAGSVTARTRGLLPAGIIFDGDHAILSSDVPLSCASVDRERARPGDHRPMSNLSLIHI